MVEHWDGRQDQCGVPGGTRIHSRYLGKMLCVNGESRSVLVAQLLLSAMATYLE